MIHLLFLCADGTQGDVESPMPLCCVIRGADIVPADGSRQLRVVDELIVDIPYLKTNSRFGVSPFTINLHTKMHRWNASSYWTRHFDGRQMKKKQGNVG